MLVSTLDEYTKEQYLNKIRYVIEKEFDDFKEKALKLTQEELFNKMEEVLFKIHVTDEILAENLRNVDNAMYVTTGDTEQILINFVAIIEKGENLLHHIWDTYNPAMEDPLVDHDAIISHLYEIYADEYDLI